MQVMITGQQRRKVDRIWGHFWVNGFANPQAMIEEISYLLFMKRQDILDRADALKHKRQQALQLVDDSLRATLLEMFGAPSSNPKGS